MAVLKEAGWVIHVNPVSGKLIIHRDSDPVEIAINECEGFYRVRLSAEDKEDQVIYTRLKTQ